MSSQPAAVASLRLFIAIELPDDVRRAIDGAIAALKQAGVDDGLRWVRPEGVHVTLKFLGQTPASKVPAISEGLRLAASGVAPFDLKPDGFGAFRRGRDLRVLWIGVGGDIDCLRTLAGRVEDAIEPLGFPREKRPFAAHLTLARMRDDADRAAHERMHAAFEPFLSDPAEGSFPAFPAFRADRVSLMQSTLERGGAVYNALATAGLDGQSKRR